MKEIFKKIGDALLIVLCFCLSFAIIGFAFKSCVNNESETEQEQEQDGGNDNTDNNDNLEEDNADDGATETLPTDVEVSPSAFTFNSTEEVGVSLVSTPLLASEYEENGVAANAISAVTITATVLPETATDKLLQWDVDFFVLDNDEAQSDWYATITAENHTVSDFVVVSPSEDTLSAVVSCLQPFGCTILMKVSSVSNANAYANVTFDYNVSVNGAFMSCVSVEDSTVSSVMEMSDLDLRDISALNPTNQIIASDNADYVITPSLTSTAGTVSTSTYLFELSLNSNFMDYMTEKGYEFNEKRAIYPAYSANFNFYYGALYLLKTDGKGYTQSSSDGAALALRDFSGSSSKTYFTFEFLQQWNSDVNEYISYKVNLAGSAPVFYTIKLVEYATEDSAGKDIYGLSFYSWDNALYPVSVEAIELSQTNVIF